jgi:hypothetical protein
MISLLLLELTWILPWFRAVTPTIQSSGDQSSLIALFLFLLLVTYANRILRAVDLQEMTHRLVLVAILLIGLYSISRLLVYPGSSISFGEVINRTILSLENVFKTIPEGFLVILMGLYLFWRGIVISSSGSFEIRAIERKFRVGILLLGFFGIIFRESQVTYMLDVLPLYFTSGLLAVTFSRTSTLGRGITAYRLPYTVSWFIGMAGLTAITILLGLFSAKALQSQIADQIFGFFSRSFEQLFNFLEILLLPLVEAFIYIAEKIIEFLTRFIDPESLLGTPQEFQGIPTPEPFQQGETIFELPPWVSVIIVILILIGLVILILRRADKRYRYPVSFVDDEGETIYGPKDVRSRFRRLLKQVREGVELVRHFGLGRRMYAATVIRRIYMQLLYLADDLGRPRLRSETPYEFQEELTVLFPDQSEEVKLITDAYVHVRYGELPEEDQIVSKVERAWDLIDKEARKIGRGIRA